MDLESRRASEVRSLQSRWCACSNRMERKDKDDKDDRETDDYAEDTDDYAD